MARRLVQRRAAEGDVGEQVAYIAADRPAVAHRYAIALEHAFERIREMPEFGVQRSFRAGGAARCAYLARSRLSPLSYLLPRDPERRGGHPRASFRSRHSARAQEPAVGAGGVSGVETALSMAGTTSPMFFATA